jgi:hypothetical protein
VRGNVFSGAVDDQRAEAKNAEEDHHRPDFMLPIAEHSLEAGKGLLLEDAVVGEQNASPTADMASHEPLWHPGAEAMPDADPHAWADVRLMVRSDQRVMPQKRFRSMSLNLSNCTSDVRRFSLRSGSEQTKGRCRISSTSQQRPLLARPPRPAPE